MRFFSHDSSPKDRDPRQKRKEDQRFWRLPYPLAQIHEREKKRKSLVVACSCLFSLFLIAPSYAFSIPEKPEAYVNDYADLLSARARQNLNDELGAFERETSNQLVVAIFPSLDGQSLEDFSIRLAEKWKIGTKGRDNGVILLIFKNDRQVRIEVGYGLEGALPDALAKRIIENEIVPAFRAGNFDAGVSNAVRAIIQATKGEYKASELPRDSLERLMPFLFFLFLLYFVLPFFLYPFVILGGAWAFGLPAGAFLTLMAFLVWIARSLMLAETFSSGRRHRGYWGGSGFGGGGWSGGSGGFGGGGGGSFGGGGASGRW